MRLIRAQDLDTAVIHLTKANNIEPSNSNYLYILTLALDKAGNTKLAIEVLKDKISAVNNQFGLLQLGLNFSQKLGLRMEYTHFQKELEKAQRQ
jgi:tetratricopeptide (TPR) repeat protein